MKVSELLKIVAEGWVKKPKGFRVRFQRWTDGRPVTEYLPDETDAPFESDVTAWRAAWKLAQATTPGDSGMEAGDIVNIDVVNDSGEPVRYYATHRFDVFNQRETSDGAAEA
jgi:hypothetical protein